VAVVRILHRRRRAEIAKEDRTQVENELTTEHAVLSDGLQRAIEIEIIESKHTQTTLAAAIATALRSAATILLSVSLFRAHRLPLTTHPCGRQFLVAFQPPPGLAGGLVLVPTQGPFV